MEAIEDKNKDIKALREALSQAEKELDILQQAYKLLSKRKPSEQSSISPFLSPHISIPSVSSTPSGEGKSLPDAAEEVLKSAQTPLHVDDIVGRIQLQFNMKVQKASLVAALSKYIKKRQRFKRTMPNTYTLIGQVNEKGLNQTN